MAKPIKSTDSRKAVLVDLFKVHWNDYPTRFKRGGFIYYDETVTEGPKRRKKYGRDSGQ